MTNLAGFSTAPCVLTVRREYQGAAAAIRTPRLSAVRERHVAQRRAKIQTRMDSTEPTEEEVLRKEQEESLAKMRTRLDGLFGVEEETVQKTLDEDFNGRALRNAVLERWGVQYDVQPQKRHGRIYVQEWNAVDYFCDYIASIKKRPVVGIAINIPIPGVTADSVSFD